jgi:hypothetical protein
MQDTNQNQLNQKEKLFSPVKRNYPKMFLTSIYFVLVAGAIMFLQNYLFNRFENTIGQTIVHSIYFFTEGGILFLILLPLVLTIVIHKSFVKGLLTLIGLVIAFAIFLFFTLDSESFGYAMLGMMGVTPVLIGISTISILARGFFRIKQKWIQVLILITPFFIIAIITGVTVINVQNVDVSYCDNLNEISTQIDCYNNLALKENDPSFCIKIEGADNVKEYCLRQLYTEINPNMCEKLEGRDHSTCYWIVADRFSDSSICDNILDSQLKSNCRRAIDVGRHYYGRPLEPV